MDIIMGYNGIMYWAKTLKHWGSQKMPALAATVRALALHLSDANFACLSPRVQGELAQCIFEASTDIEQNFAIVRHLTSSLKANTGEQTVRDHLKVLVDGPTPEQSAPRQNSSDNIAETYVRTEMVKRVQQHYRYFFDVITPVISGLTLLIPCKSLG